MTRSADRPVRLAITGSAGVGKTTLAERLGARLGVPVIEESMRHRLENGLDLHDLSKAGFRALVLDLFEEMEAASRQARQTAGGFVADRTPADFLAFWLYYGLAEDREATESLFEMARRSCRALDAVVLLPWGGIPLVDDGVRATNPWWQLHFQALLEGLIDGQLREMSVWRMPHDIVDLGERERWVTGQLDGLVSVPGGAPVETRAPGG